MSYPTAIVLGTRNRKKREELEYLLRPYGVRVQTLDEFSNAMEVKEDGSTFGENARKKAAVQAVQLATWVLGEDSGLAVDALQGEPGIYSARFAGEHGNDEANNRLLLQRLEGIPLNRRGAHYVCHASLADPLGIIRLDCEGICRGRIRTQPAGVGGFGYDPLFEIREYHKTFGELGAETKAALSHRARAMRELLRCWHSLVP